MQKKGRGGCRDLHDERPNVVFELLILLLLIRGIPGSNLCLETGYPD
jgi:hypothetical protein